MSRFHSYNKKAGHWSSRYESKIPRRGCSDLVVLWSAFSERTSLNSHVPRAQIGSAYHRKQRQGGVGGYLTRLYSGMGQSDDLASLDSFSRYGVTAAPVKWKIVTTVENLRSGQEGKGRGFARWFAATPYSPRR